VSDGVEFRGKTCIRLPGISDAKAPARCAGPIEDRSTHLLPSAGDDGVPDRPTAWPPDPRELAGKWKRVADRLLAPRSCWRPRRRARADEASRLAALATLAV